MQGLGTVVYRYEGRIQLSVTAQGTQTGQTTEMSASGFQCG
jgi:hypothetical protein